MNVAEFARKSIERAGGAVEETAPNMLEALLPDSLADEEPMALLAFDSDALAAHPEAEPAMVGSPFLDRLIHFASEKGTVARGYVRADHLRKKGMKDEMERTLTFVNCRVRFEEREPDILNDPYLLCNFRVSYVSEERREKLHLLPVCLRTSQVNMELAKRLPSLEIAESLEGEPFVNASAVALLKAHDIAREAVKRIALEEATARQSHAGKRFEAEYARISDYYSQMILDLEKRKARETEEGRIASVDQKIEAARFERERKLKELSETYSLRIRVRLASARLLYQPKTFFKIFIDRGKETRALTLAYDSVLERLEPPLCESCQREASRYHFAASGRIVCSDCFEAERTGGSRSAA